MKKSRCFEITFLFVILLQNGYLKNRPALLLLIPIFNELIQSNWKIRKLNKEEVVVFLFGTYLLAITIINGKNLYDIENVINVFIQYFLIFLSVHLCYKRIDICHFFISYRNIGFILSLLCIVEQLVQINFLSIVLGKASMYSGVFRVSSIFGHPILCGVFLSVYLLILLYYPFKDTIIQYVAFISGFMALIFTKSRSAWIAIAFCLLVYFIKNHNTMIRKISRKRFAVYTILVFASLAIIMLFGRTYISNLYSTVIERINGSFNAGEGQIVRIETIVNSFNYWLSGNQSKMIFGSGMNADLLFMSEHPVIKFNGSFVWSAAIDNQYISIIHECGLIGLCIFFIMIKKSFMLLFAKKNKNKMLLSLVLLSINIILFFFEGLKYVSIVLLALLLYTLNSGIED